MGTSQSSVGPNGRSPLLPAWVDESQATTQTPDPQRLKGLVKQSVGLYEAVDVMMYVKHWVIMHEKPVVVNIQPSKN